MCFSVTSRSHVEMAERIELVFGMGASFHVSYTELKGNSGIYKNKSTSLWNFAQTPDLEDFATAYRSSKRVISLARERWEKVDAQSMINWTVVSQLSRQYLRALTLDCDSLSHWSSSSVYSMILPCGLISDSWYLFDYSWLQHKGWSQHLSCCLWWLCLVRVWEHHREH